MSESRSISLPNDDEGYTSFQCPHCQGRFKLTPPEVTEDPQPSRYCSLCGMKADASEFLTNEVLEVAEAEVENMVADLLNDWMRGMERQFRGNKFVSFKADKPMRKRPVPELREVTNLAIFELPCCGASVKVPDSDALSTVYCPYCGMEHA